MMVLSLKRCMYCLIVNYKMTCTHFKHYDWSIPMQVQSIPCRNVPALAVIILLNKYLFGITIQDTQIKTLGMLLDFQKTKNTCLVARNF